MIAIEWDAGTLQTTLRGIQSAVDDLRPAWGDVHDIFRAFMREIFRSQGSYAGSQWKPLNRAYAAYKQRKWGNKPILQASGTLMRSFVSETDANHVLRVGPTFAEFGSRVLYAKAHQFGYPPRKLPARPMIQKFTRAEGERVVDAILTHVLKSARRGPR